jgi:hypothetical protein
VSADRWARRTPPSGFDWRSCATCDGTGRVLEAGADEYSPCPTCLSIVGFAETDRCGERMHGTRCLLRHGHWAYPSALSINGHFFGEETAHQVIADIRAAAKSALSWDATGNIELTEEARAKVEHRTPVPLGYTAADARARGENVPPEIPDCAEAWCYGFGPATLNPVGEEELSGKRMPTLSIPIVRPFWKYVTVSVTLAPKE